jgi:hypothetical protein
MIKASHIIWQVTSVAPNQPTTDPAPVASTAASAAAATAEEKADTTAAVTAASATVATTSVMAASAADVRVASAAAMTAATAMAAAATMANKLHHRRCSVAFFVEYVERSQADIRDFFLTEEDLIAISVA